VTVQRQKGQTRHADGYGMLTSRGEPRRLADFDVANAMRRERGR
jgi:hypothetical protein